MVKNSIVSIVLAIFAVSIFTANSFGKDSNLVENNGIMVTPENQINPPLEAGNATEASAEPLATYYLSISAEAFVPGSNVAYTNTYGMGGAYIKSAVNGALVAQVHLPHGAIIREFRVYFNDNSSRNLSVSLERLNLVSGGYSIIGNVSSSGVSGYGNRVVYVTSTVNNLSYGYHIYAWCAPWDPSGNLRIMGARIRYTY